LIDSQTVLVTHYPAAGILDNNHGLPAIRHVIDCSSYLAHIHGHSHNRFGHEGRHFNVASAAQHRAMVIDLEDRTYQVVENQTQSSELSW
jgi:Icc-related predicted phosphoesterase